MKKIFSLLLVLTLFFTLVGCGGEEEQPAGDNNTPQEENSVVVEGGDSTCEHSYGNPEVTYQDNKIILVSECVDCGAKKTEVQVVDTTVDNAASWDETFQGFKLENFTMKVYIGGKNNPQGVNHCIVTNDAVYYHLARAVEYYALKNADGSYVLYYSEYDYNYNNNTYTKDQFYYVNGEFAKECLEGAKVETVLQISFATNFDKFTYDSATGTYRASELIAAKYYDQDGRELGTLYCYNSEVKVVNGKISSISCDYLFPEDNGQIPAIPETPEYSLEYYNIGISQVSVPEEIVKNAPLGDIDQEQPSHNEGENIGGGVNDQFALNVNAIVGEWAFMHYHQNDGEMSFDFAPGDDVDGYVVSPEDFMMVFNEDGTGVYTEFGTNIRFNWVLVSENALALEFPDTGESGVAMFKDSTIFVFNNSEGTIQIIFNKLS